MIPKLRNYMALAGRKAIEDIKAAAENLKDKHVVHINSTSAGGGVAEILNTLVFLMEDVGIHTGWRTLVGSHSFFKITKGIHNSLQGQKWIMSDSRKKVYTEFCERNAMINHIKDHDVVFIHDPQPLGMVTHYEKKTAWIWRCHIDLSHPYRDTLSFLLPYMRRFDAAIVSTPQFKVRSLGKPQYVVPPSIDPLSRKNKRISHEKAGKFLRSHGIDTDKPIVCQISRFDPWKDHLGVIKMYEEIKKKEDCQLVLMGDTASDDPQGPLIFHDIKKRADSLKDVTLITENNDLLVNCLQQESAFVFQNSRREGFALTVSEALWKKTPVIARRVGGIPLQVKHGKNGYLINSRNEGVKCALRILRDSKVRTKLGTAGHDHIKKNFLVTRHLKDYLDICNQFYPTPHLNTRV